MPFCDAGCGGAAITSWGSTYSSGVNNVDRSFVQVGDSTDNVVSTLTSVGADIGQLVTDNTFDITSSLSAATNIIKVAHVQQIKSNERLTDHLLTNISVMMKDLFRGEEVIKINDMMGNSAQPATGELSVNMISDLKKGVIKSRKMTDIKIDKFDEYQHGIAPSENSALESRRLVEGIDVDVIIAMLDDGHVAEESKAIEEIFTYLIDKNLGKTNPTNDSKILVSDLTRKSKLAYVYGSLLSSLSYKAKNIDPSSASHYFSGNVAEAISIDEYLLGLIDGRLMSNQWFLNIKLMNNAGLIRERLYLRAEEAAIQFLISNLKESSNNILALSVAEDIKPDSAAL